MEQMCRRDVEAIMEQDRGLTARVGEDAAGSGEGLLLQGLKRDRQAEAELLKALEIEPKTLEFLLAPEDYYAKRGTWKEASEIARD